MYFLSGEPMHYLSGVDSSGGESGLNLFINDVKKIQVVEPPPIPQVAALVSSRRR
jgi:hypothetical protein